MTSKRRTLLLIALFIVGSAIVALPKVLMTARAETPPMPQSQPQPVEKNMHEFMEYVFQPTYQRLKQSMAGLPANSGAWKGIKSDALILAEGGNLLLLRARRKPRPTGVSSVSP